MNLQLAIALTCTETGCETRALGETDSFHAERSEPMIENQIIVRAGDLIVVDRQDDSSQVVFRLPQFQVERVSGERIFINAPSQRGAPVSRAEGVDTNIAAGDRVFAANGQIYDMALNGQPANPERLQAVLFPQIKAMYQQMETWNTLDPKRVVEQGYNCIAERYLESVPTIRLEERTRYTSVLLDQLSPGAHVLDLGCGAGVPTTRALAQHFRVTGVDISEHQIALARKSVPAAEFIQADMTQLDLPNASYDAVIAFYSLIHVPRQEQSKVLQNIALWLRPGGLFVAAMSTRPAKRDFGEDYMGARMFWSGYDSETNKRLVEESGLRILQAQEETALEFERPVTFLWVIANKPKL